VLKLDKYGSITKDEWLKQDLRKTSVFDPIFEEQNEKALDSVNWWPFKRKYILLHVFNKGDSLYKLTSIDGVNKEGSPKIIDRHLVYH